MRVVGGGWCVTVFYFVLFFFLPCAYNFPNWEKKKKRKVLFRVACPQTVRPRVTAAAALLLILLPVWTRSRPRVVPWSRRGSTGPPLICAVQTSKARTCQSLSRVWLFATPWTVVCQASLSVRVFRQEHWSGLPFSSSGGSPQPRDRTLLSWVSFVTGGFLTCWATREAL